MCCKQKILLKFSAFLIGAVALNSLLMGADDAVESGIHVNTWSCIPHNGPASPSAMFHLMSISQTASEPLAYLFQILFFLFIISPPLIVILLFMIWKELKSRNKLK